jgi:hypothetical protein
MHCSVGSEQCFFVLRATQNGVIRYYKKSRIRVMQINHDRPIIYNKDLIMNITRSILAIAFCCACLSANAQSKTTEMLHKKYTDAMSLFFYNNTLRMINQKEDKDLDALIKDIEKMKFLMIRKPAGFSAADYKKLTADYKSEAFEEMMTSRIEGKTFDVFAKEKDGKTKGMLVLVNDQENLYVLDIVGRIALDQVGNLYKTIDSSTEIGQKIRDFTGHGGKGKEVIIK